MSSPFLPPRWCSGPDGASFIRNARGRARALDQVEFTVLSAGESSYSTRKPTGFVTVSDEGYLGQVRILRPKTLKRTMNGGPRVKSILSTIESEILGPFTRLVVPGSLVVGAMILAGSNWGLVPAIAWAEPMPLFGLSGAILLFGMTLESAGTHLEARWDKGLEDAATRRNRNVADDIDVMGDWHAYLRLCYEIEAVGHRYLRTRVVQLKFELNAGLALVLAGMITSVASIGSGGSWPLVLTGAGLGLGLGTYLVWEARNTQRLLVKIRHELLRGLTRVP